MKFCKKCKKSKEESEFGLLQSAKDGLNYQCRECQREKMNKYRENPLNRKKMNENAAKYRRSNKGKATKKRYYFSEKGIKAYKQYNQNTIEKKARKAVADAIALNIIPPANNLQCAMRSHNKCEGQMEYHHYKGYSKKHFLDIMPLCRKHHCIVHGENYHSL